jgi:hypothetical protein
MRLREEILAAGMTPAVARRFAESLRDVALSDGRMGSAELVAVESLIDSITAADDDVAPAPIDALMPYRELFSAHLHLPLRRGRRVWRRGGPGGL